MKKHGVASDLCHICTRSGVSAVVAAGDLPLSPAYRAFCTAAEIDLPTLALSGGEDYNLLFAVEAERAETVEALGRLDGLPPLSRIGRIEAGAPRVFCENDKGVRGPLEPSGYDHFKPQYGGPGGLRNRTDAQGSTPGRSP